MIYEFELRSIEIMIVMDGTVYSENGLQVRFVDFRRAGQEENFLTIVRFIVS